jgi:hypothetical protein
VNLTSDRLYCMLEPLSTCLEVYGRSYVSPMTRFEVCRCIAGSEKIISFDGTSQIDRTRKVEFVSSVITSKPTEKARKRHNMKNTQKSKVIQFSMLRVFYTKHSTES